MLMNAKISWMWPLFWIFTRNIFQPRSKKAEKFDYVSSLDFVSSALTRRDCGKTVIHCSSSSRWWSSWKTWQAKSMWASVMPRECIFKNISVDLCLNLFSSSCALTLSPANYGTSAVLMDLYWLSVTGSSQKRKPETETLQSATT